jgi:hypothetical protein
MPTLNLGDVIKTGLAASRRPPDGLLHCSQDLLGSVRHAQLRLAGAPENTEPITSSIRMQTGTLWHRYIGELLERQGIAVMREVNVTPGLPEGWSGTLDLMTWEVDPGGHMIRDLKTQRAEAFRFANGIKEDHLWQLSAYQAAAKAMGYPMLDEVEAVYVPMNALTGRDEVGIVSEREHVLPAADLWMRMENRWELVQAYLAIFRETIGRDRSDPQLYLNDLLAPPLPREQRIAKAKDGQIDVLLRPNWRAAYCPYDPPLCDCKLQGQTKIGQYVPVDDTHYTYEPREGYEEIEPTVEPTEGEVIRV